VRALAEFYSLPGPRSLIIPLEAVLGAVWLAAFIDIVRKPSWAFEDASVSGKVFWLVVALAGGGCFFIVSAIAAVVWFTSTRPKVVSAMRASAENLA
jgi:hypothetical protein